MSSKRGKLTADKARERITSLEESIEARTQKLESLNNRIARTANPEEKLLHAKERLVRRVRLEQEQIQKLKRLLGRREAEPPRDSAEFFASEEYDELHRSFEEVKQDLTKVKARLENADVPRDLPVRLSSFEERISRREEADSDLFSQLLELQTALEQERQTVRRLSRRIREQDQNLDALREAVEDSVVATVDLAERLEELEENINDPSPGSSPHELLTMLRSEFLQRFEQLGDRLDGLTVKVNQLNYHEVPDYAAEVEDISRLVAKFDSRLAALEQRPEPAPPATTPTAPSVPEPAAKAEPVADPLDIEPIDSTPEPPVVAAVIAEESSNDWVPAKFADSGSRGRLVAKFSTEPLVKFK